MPPTWAWSRRRDYHAAGRHPPGRCPPDLGGRSGCPHRPPIPAGIATALGVEHLLVGTIQPADQTYRVSVQLVRADGVAVWGSTYDEPRTALLTLQDRLAEHVVSALRIELAAADRARLHVRYTDNPDAYDRYLRGRSLLLNYTEANMRSAIQQFEQALQLDQNYALAHAGIATASAWFSVRYAHRAEENQWAKRADDEAARALALDGSLPEAHLASASAAGTPFGGYDWKALLARTTDALALDPSLEIAHLARMRAYYHLGLFEAAAREGREAVRLNPAHSVEFDRLDVALLLYRGEFAKAVESAQPLRQRTDAPAVPHYFGLALYYTGDADGGRAMLESIRRGTTPDIRAQASLASIEAASGRPTEARARLARILAASELDHHVAYSVGAAFAQLGDGGRREMAGAGRDHRVSLLPMVRAGSAAEPGASEPAFCHAAGPSSDCGPGRAPASILTVALLRLSPAAHHAP